MDEDDDMVFGQHEVWPPGYAVGMKPKAARVQDAAESKLRLRGLSASSGHHPGTGLLIHDIGRCILSFGLEPGMQRLDEIRQESALAKAMAASASQGPGHLQVQLACQAVCRTS